MSIDMMDAGLTSNMTIDTEHYLLTCYRYNAIGQADSLITPHYKYNELNKTNNMQQQGYRALFKAHISDKQLDDIRTPTNKEWVLGSDYFKAKIEEKLERRTSPLLKGGDRKSKQWREQHAINRH